MGNSSSCLEAHPDYPSEVDIETDLGIEGELVNDKICNSKVQRVLLLGSAGAGKSTLSKHAKQIYGQSYKDDDRRAFIVPIHKQIIEQMKLCIRVYIEWNHRQTQRKEYQMRMAARLHIIDEDIELDEETKINNDNEDANAHSLPELIQDCSEELDELLIWDQIELKCPALQNEKAAKMVLSFQQESQPFDEEIGSAIKQLWNEPIVKEIYALRNITCVEASSAHFWDKVMEICDKDKTYLPTMEDVLLCRQTTTRVYEIRLCINGNPVHLVDVGGQTSERRKWIHCFDHVVAVIFIAALDTYDQVMVTDNSKNVMVDQLELFESLNLSMPIMLLLNKVESFEQKYGIEHVPLNKCTRFHDFKGGESDGYNVEYALQYVCRQFESLNTTKANIKCPTHMITATDRSDIEKVISSIQETVLKNNLAVSGLFKL